MKATTMIRLGGFGIVGSIMTLVWTSFYFLYRDMIRTWTDVVLVTMAALPMYIGVAYVIETPLLIGLIMLLYGGEEPDE